MSPDDVFLKTYSTVQKIRVSKGAVTLTDHIRGKNFLFPLSTAYRRMKHFQTKHLTVGQCGEIARPT